jgi:hypothetical protein
MIPSGRYDQAGTIYRENHALSDVFAVKHDLLSVVNNAAKKNSPAI